MSSPDQSAIRARTVVRWLFMGLVFCGLLAFAIAPVCAQSDAKSGSDATTDVGPVLDSARAQIDMVQKRLKERLDDADMAHLRETVLQAQTQAKAAATKIEPQLASVKARLAELGAPAAGAPEAPDVAAQRDQLGKSSSTLDSQLKLARLLTVEADQATEQIQAKRRSQFQARLGERTGSVLGQSFWTELGNEWPRDARRLKSLHSELADLASATPPWVWALLVLAIAATLGLRVLAGHTLMRLTTTRVPPGRLRRSLYAGVQVLLAVAVPGLIAEFLRLGIGWTGPVSDTMSGLLGWLVGLVCFASLVGGLGYALLAPERPSWRLPPLPDTTATGLRWFPLALALVIGAGWTAQHLATVVNVSLVTAVALDCVIGLLINLTVGAALLRARRLRRLSQPAPEKGGIQPSPLWVTALATIAWLALTISLVCILVGYVSFGSFVARQLVWIATVLGTAYLLSVLMDDGCTSLLAAVKRRSGDEHGARAMTRARSQVIVLLSGLGRLLVLVFTLMLLLMPLGEGPSEWLTRAQRLYTGISIGEAQIRPTAVLLAVTVLVLGIGGVKMLQGWLVNRYLPTTSLDPGMRISASTLFSYAGYVLIVALALSAAGIGLERVAWIASALSVGIGFGLQAVVQNFVSGLILLAERPVKVGDWVSLGGVEGDIRRINVRATEIQMGDRSTVIVPNSEFITKIVRNVTHANPIGRVQIKLPMPMTIDPEQVRSLVLEAFHDHPDVLEQPAPGVLLDGIEASGLVFSATGYVSSPRSTGGVRSDLLFEVLRRLREAGLSLSHPPTMLLTDSAGAAALPATAAAAPPAQQS